jgi:hypothetical protein
MGGMMYMMGAMAAYQGIITGRGPTNPTLRATWLETNDPYTIKIGGHAWSYRRGDPVFTCLGLIADFVHMTGELGTGDVSDGAAILLAALTANLSNKTYFRSMVRLLESVSSGDPTQMGNTIAELTITTGVPFSAMMGQVARMDPIMREANTFVEQLQANIPGWSSTLEPRRNLFGEIMMRAPGHSGEKQNPFQPGMSHWGKAVRAARRTWEGVNRTFSPYTVTEVEPDIVVEEIVKLGRSFGMPGEYLDEGRFINMRNRERYHERGGQSPYDRMLELMNSQTLGNELTLKQALTQMVSSKEWAEASGGTSIVPGGERHNAVTRLVGRYWRAAKARAISEYPSLQNDIRYINALSQASARGGEDAIARVNALFGVD